MTPFPISEATPIRFQGGLPERVDVAVVGGGIIGVMTALSLAQRGQKVLLCEKGRIAGEQSSRNWGWIRQQGRDLAELPIVSESLRLWQDLSEKLGPALGFRQTGVTYLARREAGLAGFEAWLVSAQGYGLDSHMLSRSQIESHLPQARGGWVGGLYTPSDARAEPWVAVPMLAAYAAAEGVIIRENCAVRGLDLTAGRVSGVFTEAGLVGADQVVVAGGAWSRLLLGAHGVALPQLAVRSTACATAPVANAFEGAAVDETLAFRARADGGYTLAPGDHQDFYIGPDAFASLKTYWPLIGRTFTGMGYQLKAPAGFPDAWGTPRRFNRADISPFERMRVLNPAPNLKLVRKLQARFAAVFPHIGRPEITCAWAGMIDTMPDVVPVIDRAPQISGLVIATGMCGHGFGIGPGMGRVVADLTLGRAVGHDLARFRYGRFTDGSKLVTGPAL